MSEFVVIGYMEDTGHTFFLDLTAGDPMQAFALAANRTHGPAIFVCAVGTFGRPVHFPGEGVATRETILEQPDVFPLFDRAADRGLTAEQLDDKYNPEGDGEHPHYTRQTWRDAVANEFTVSCYWDWVAHKLTEDDPS